MDPILDLTGAIVSRLKASSGLAGFVGDRIYDHVPADGKGQPVAEFPYVSFGSASAMESDADCIEAVEVMFRVDAWSRAVGFPEVLRIAGAVRAALHGHDLTLTDNALVEIRWRRTDRMRDPDGLTSHAVIEFAATIETP